MAEAPSVAAASAAQARPGADAGRMAQFAWALCDGSRVPYNVLVNIFVFSAYYTSTVFTDGVQGQAQWSFITATGAIIVALTAPILGAIADAGGRRKPWIAVTYIVGAPAMMLLWFATPGMTEGLMLITVAVILGNLFYEYSQIFTNAMLPNIAPPERIGFLSGAGLALGNLSGIILFCFFLFAWSWNDNPLFGLSLEQHEPERAVGILAGIWAILFCLPLFFFTLKRTEPLPTPFEHPPPPDPDRPPVGDPSALQEVLRTGRAVNSDLLFGLVAGKLLFTMNVPVFRDGKIRYVLNAAFEPDVMTRFLQESAQFKGVPAWIYDRRGLIVGRWRDADKYVGRRVPPRLRRGWHRPHPPRR